MEEDARQRIEDLERAVLNLLIINDWTLAYLKKTGNARDVEAYRHTIGLCRDLITQRDDA